MSTDRTELKLRVPAGRFEQRLIYLILVVQLSLVLMLGMMSAGWLYFTTGAWVDPNRSATILFRAIPVLFGIGVGVYLLGFLYE
jgi:hypothetical protein